MKIKNQVVDKISTLHNLPTLPHILLKLLDVCHQDDVNLDKIAYIVSTDPSLSVKILKLVNSAYFGLPQKVHEIGQAVVLIGTNGIKNITICACVYEAFPKFNKNGIFNFKAFWWHSLRCAFLAKNIAAKVDSGCPDEAFISGLLHDIGKSVLWINFNETYEDLLKDSLNDKDLLLEGEARMGATHNEVAAWLLNRWNFQPEVVDPVFYHHEKPGRIALALPQVQIVYVANKLSQDSNLEVNAGVELAQSFFGITSEECQNLIVKSNQDAKEVATSLDIDVDAHEPLSETIQEKDQNKQNSLVTEVRDVSLLMGTLEGFLTARDQYEILSVISTGLKILFDIKRLLFFLIDIQKNVLFGHVSDKQGRYIQNHNLSVSLSLNRSLLVRSLLERRSLNSFGAATQNSLTIIDEQIIRLLGGDGMFCLPLCALDDSVGVIALAIDQQNLAHLLKDRKLLTIFTNKGAMALRLDYLKRNELDTIQKKRMEASQDLARRVVHEVNNPLGIIKNYLQILGMKLCKVNIAQEEIRIINEEINRVVHLLKDLTKFSTQRSPTKEMTDINELLVDIVKLTKESLLKYRNVELLLDLENDLPKVTVEKDEVKQVFINLIKNAAEAMERDGKICIVTRCLSAPIGNKSSHEQTIAKDHLEIKFTDNGPGIPEAIKENLFEPYVSTKGGGHSGVGLSVVYNIIKSNGGNITCDSSPDSGTVFKIELPL